MGFEITTGKPLHKPITITVDGKVFTACPINREVLEKIDQLAHQAVEGKVAAAYEQLELIFGKHKQLDALDIRDVNALLTYLTVEVFKSERADTKEKKDKGPGGKS